MTRIFPVIQKIKRTACRILSLILMICPLAGHAQAPLSQDVQDGLLHVIAHEMEHAKMREFDLPLLGPEESIADDFATIYIHLMLPDRAQDIISARARQHLKDNAKAGMFSEYRDDAQIAGRMICILYGQDPDSYAGMADQFGLTGDAANRCRDFATEVGRGWRRIIANYRMPEGVRVTEVGFYAEDTPVVHSLRSTDFLDDAYHLLSAIDWHSRITFAINECDGSAAWSRNGRRITLCAAYIARFEEDLAQ